MYTYSIGHRNSTVQSEQNISGSRHGSITLLPYTNVTPALGSSAPTPAQASLLALRQHSLVGPGVGLHHPADPDVTKRIDSIGKQLDQLESKVTNDISAILTILKGKDQGPPRSTSQPSEIAKASHSLT